MDIFLVVLCAVLFGALLDVVAQLNRQNRDNRFTRCADCPGRRLRVVH